MINGLGYKLANVPTITGLATITADNVISDITNTDQLFIDGVDVSSEVNNQKARIVLLEQKTTGITYSDVGSIDLTTIDNNLTITSGKVLTVNGVNITSALTGITYDNTAGADLTTIDNNVKMTKNVAGTQFTISTGGAFVTPVVGDKAGLISYNDGANSFIIQNQETSGTMQFRAFDASNVLKVVLELSSSIFDTITTTNPTISGFTDPIASDSTSKVATTRWVQSAISSIGPGASSTIAVAVNNTATIMYPIFATTGAGQKSLLFDTTSTPLSYKPDTSTLTASVFSLNALGRYSIPTTVPSSISGGGTDITILNDNIGGVIEFRVATSFLPLNVLSFSTSSAEFRVPTIVSLADGGGAKTTPYFTVEDETTPFGGFNVIPNTTASALNPITDLNDTLLYGASNTIGTQNLSLSVWSSTTSGVRITPTSALIGAGGTASTPTSSVSCSGTTVSVVGNPIVENRNIIVNNANGNQAISVGTGGTNANSCLIITNTGNAVDTVNFTVAGAGNTIVGVSAGSAMTSLLFDDTYVGDNAGGSSTGSSNTCVGKNAGSNITSGSNNTCIGKNSSVPTPGGSNQVGLGSTSDSIFIRGGLNIRIGALITNNITLPTGGLPLAQHYPVAMSAASCIITLPAPGGVAVLGAMVSFKRRTNTTAFTIAAGAGTPFLPTNSITGTANYAMGVGAFQVSFICDGVNWCVISNL